MKFNDKYLFNWMNGKDQNEEHRSLPSWFDILPDKSSLSPTFDFAKHSAVSIETDMSEKIQEMVSLVPPWYWQRLRFCSFHYFSFWNRLWPKFAEVTNELVFLEWLLHVEPGYLKYRDHLLHMFKVACLGTWFLQNKTFNEEIDQPYFSQQTVSWAEKKITDQELIEELRNYDPSKKISERLLRIACWSFLFAALLHDVGYAYSFRKYFDSYTSRLNNWLASTCINSEPSMHTQFLFKNSLVGEFLQNIETKSSKNFDRRLSGLLRDNLFLNHSFASSVFVLILEDRLTESGSINDDWRLALQIASEAILFHDLTSDRNHCGFPKNHLKNISTTGKLLILCDELAIWSRPRISGKRFFKTGLEKFDKMSVLLSFDNSKPDELIIDFEKNNIVISLPGQELNDFNDLKDKVKELKRNCFLRSWPKFSFKK